MISREIGASQRPPRKGVQLLAVCSPTAATVTNFVILRKFYAQNMRLSSCPKRLVAANFPLVWSAADLLWVSMVFSQPRQGALRFARNLACFQAEPW